MDQAAIRLAGRYIFAANASVGYRGRRGRCGADHPQKRFALRTRRNGNERRRCKFGIVENEPAVVMKFPASSNGATPTVPSTYSSGRTIVGYPQSVTDIGPAERAVRYLIAFLVVNRDGIDRVRYIQTMIDGYVLGVANVREPSRSGYATAAIRVYDRNGRLHDCAAGRGRRRGHRKRMRAAGSAAAACGERREHGDADKQGSRAPVSGMRQR